MNTLKTLFALFFSACLLCACGGTAPGLTGIYVNHASGEFSIADDTLVVEHVSGPDYLIHRKTGFRVISEAGLPGKPEYEREEWKAVFDEGSGTMTENRKGRVISFVPEKGLLKLENSVYQRIN